MLENSIKSSIKIGRMGNKITNGVSLLVILEACGCECTCGRLGCRGEIGHMLTGQVPIYKYQVCCGGSLGSSSFLATALAHHPPVFSAPCVGSKAHCILVLGVAFHRPQSRKEKSR